MKLLFKVEKQKHTDFKVACVMNNTDMTTVLNDAIDKYIKEHKQRLKKEKEENVQTKKGDSEK